MVSFHHLDAGTPEARWHADPRMTEVQDLHTGIDELVVVAAHPDDETLGAAGLIRRVLRTGGRVTVIVATDGEGSHPDSPTHTPAQLSRLRHAEVADALAVLGTVDLRFLGLPDGALRESSDRLVEAVRDVVDDRRASASGRDRVMIVAPWSGDGHRDHRVAAAAVARVCAGRGIRHLGYPIWLWHWGAPDDLPWERIRGLRLSNDERAAKREAIGLHTSQIEPLSPARGDEAVVHAGMRAHFDRAVELFVEEAPVQGENPASMTGEWFEAFYARHGVPAKRAVMAGDSMRSDVLPALAAGAWAAFIPQELAWSHEAADAPEHPRFRALPSLSDLPDWIDAIA